MSQQPKGSHYNMEVVIKESADLHGKALRFLDARSLASEHFTHFRATYNAFNEPTQATYYRGTTPHITKIVPTGSTGLNNKYFSIYSVPHDKKYTIWFNIDGAGVQPSVPGTFDYIEIALDSGLPAVMVSVLLSMALPEALSPELFAVSRNGTSVDIRTIALGTAIASSAGNSGFSVTNVNGEQETLSDVVIEYVGGNPVYNGQAMPKMHFNVFTGKFEKNAADTNSTEKYSVQDSEDNGAGTTYVGSVTEDGLFLIKRIVESGSNIQIRYASTSNNPLQSSYSDAWANRATLSYDLLSSISNL